MYNCTTNWDRTKLEKALITKAKCLENRAMKPKTHIVPYQHALLLNIGVYLFRYSKCSARRLVSATENTRNPDKQEMLETCSAGDD